MTVDAPRTRDFPNLEMVILIALACLLTAAYFRGPWLDEFWTYWYAQNDLDFLAALRQRWLTDLNQPFYYAYIWLTEPLTGDDIVMRRLTNVVPLAYFLGLTIYCTRRNPGSTTTFLLFAALVLTAPVAIATFCNLRSYFFQICSAASLSLLLIQVHRTDDFSIKTDKLYLVFLAVTLFLSFNLHIMNSFINGFVVGAGVLTLWLQNRRRWAIVIVGLSAISVLILVITLLYQIPLVKEATESFPIRPSAWSGLEMALSIIGLTLVAAPVTTYAAAAALLRRRREVTQDGVWADPNMQLGAALLLAAAAGMVGLVVVNALNPFLSARYFYAAAPYLLAALILLGSTKLRSTPNLIRLACICAIVVAIASTAFMSRRANWNATAKLLTEQLAACPASPIVTLSPKLASTEPQVFFLNEDRIFELGYRTVASWHNLALADKSSIRDYRGKCPILVWVEHLYCRPSVDLIAQNLGLPPGRIARSQILPGSSGLVALFWVGQSP